LGDKPEKRCFGLERPRESDLGGRKPNERPEGTWKEKGRGGWSAKVGPAKHEHFTSLGYKGLEGEVGGGDVGEGRVKRAFAETAAALVENLRGFVRGEGFITKLAA